MPNNKKNCFLYAYHNTFTSETGGSMYLAVQKEDGAFLPLNQSFGVLFPKADLQEGKLCGTDKILLFPWVFRMKDGAFGVVSLRRNVNHTNSLAMPEVLPEPGRENCVLFFRSSDMLAYEEIGLFEIAPKGTLVTDIGCWWRGDQYVLTLQTNQGNFQCCSYDLTHFSEVTACESKPDRIEIGIDSAASACKIDVTQAEYRKIVNRLLPLENNGIRPMEVTVKAGASFILPNAELTYSDGSTFQMPVEWQPFDTACKGTYTVMGKLKQKTWAFPVMPERGDPMAIRYRGKYYFMATDDEHGQLSLKIRSANSIDDIAAAEDHTIFSASEGSNFSGCFWAPELHLIKDNLFIFFAVGKPHWYTVQSHIMKLIGDDPLNPRDWSGPHQCQNKDGGVLCSNGITLDMTVLNMDTDVYTIWAQRQICNPDNHGNSDLYIAKVDPQEPWRHISDDVLLKHPLYGWERIHSAVNEGPFVLRHGDDIFVTYAGALIDHTYCVGLLRAKIDSDLLDPKFWSTLNYPVLHRNSIPDQIGGGHNSFVKDEYGNDILMTHAIPLAHYRNDPADIRRYPAFRAVHWDSEGWPRLDMTPERELNPSASDVSAVIHII